MEYIILGIIIIAIILVMPEFFKIFCSYNPLENEGLIYIKFWFIYIKYFTFQLKTSGIIIRTKKSRKQIEYNFSDPKIKFVEIFMHKIKEKININFAEMYSVIGLNDSSKTANMSACVNILFHLIYAHIMNSKPKSNLVVNSYTRFNQKVFYLSTFGKISISFWDILLAFIYAFFHTPQKKSVNNSDKNVKKVKK